MCPSRIALQYLCVASKTVRVSFIEQNLFISKFDWSPVFVHQKNADGHRLINPMISLDDMRDVSFHICIMIGRLRSDAVLLSAFKRQDLTCTFDCLLLRDCQV